MFTQAEIYLLTTPLHYALLKKNNSMEYISHDLKPITGA